MQKKAILLLAVIFIGVAVLTQSLFTVDQTQRAIVLQLGKPVSDDSLGPGLHFKLPFVQNVVYVDSRILDYDAKPEEFTTEDKKYMDINSYSKWRIVNPLQFYRTVQNVPAAQARLDDIIRSQLRVELGRYKLIEIVSLKRPEIMEKVTAKSKELLDPYGIEVVDVRIKRTDLPTENQRAIYGRMKAERERQAKQYRSEGREAADKIKAKADKERTILLAEAKRTAEEVRGQGDAKATKIYADSMGQSPEFYDFQRSLTAYRNSLKGGSKFIMTPESPFLKFFQ
ncbi:protease modulator HflC [Desulfovibrio oxyclinae]|jgi:membrane protease subunit HflC|uniref:protease modulator HflC n=1 Tax=Desulfovibrio oxyclinae TaxID=63560 RepID=UPI0003814C63|nr:protease modulator HflC [Desulfovibrio oxyclinae]